MFYAMIAVAAIASTPAPRAARGAEVPATRAPETAPASQAKPTNYCVVEVPTGSHLRQRTCHTRAEWLELGFDPLARNR